MTIRIDSPDDACRGTMKSRVEELAIFGGAPSFAEPLHVGRPNVVGKSRILSRISDILDRAWLTNDGQVLREFETAVARYAKVDHCVAVCNGTLALQLASRALDLDGEVIMPSLTFVATPQAVVWAGGTPVFADVDRHSWTLDPADVMRHVTDRTRGIMGVHLWGQTCDVDALLDIAQEHELKLVFDASHALGCTYRGRDVGCFGNCETISFHATKFVNAAEGGAILTNDGLLAERLRQLRNFGFSEPGQVESIGTNAKMSEISAAIGLTSLEYADRLIELNAENHASYCEEFDSIPSVNIRRFNAPERCNYQYVVGELDLTRTDLLRDELLSVLRSENVLARRYFFPGCHRLKPFDRPNRGSGLAWTERILDRVITLPAGLSVDREDIRAIAQIVRLAVTNAADVRRQLRRAAESAESAVAVNLGLPASHLEADTATSAAPTY